MSSCYYYCSCKLKNKKKRINIKNIKKKIITFNLFNIFLII